MLLYLLLHIMLCYVYVYVDRSLFVAVVVCGYQFKSLLRLSTDVMHMRKDTTPSATENSLGLGTRLCSVYSRSVEM